MSVLIIPVKLVTTIICLREYGVSWCNLTFTYYVESMISIKLNNMKWIYAMESDMDFINQYFGEPTLFGTLFMGLKHKMSNGSIACYVKTE